jgi:hypothetical protein
MGRGQNNAEEDLNLSLRGRTEKIEVENAGPIPYQDLSMAGDPDLERQIDARFGCDPRSLEWRLISVPLSALASSIPKEGLAYYHGLARDDEEILESLNISSPSDEYTEDFEESGFSDGARRASLVEKYRDLFLQGVEVEPIVICLDEEVPLLDGYHRLAGAYEAKMTHIKAYDLLPE